MGQRERPDTARAMSVALLASTPCFHIRPTHSMQTPPMISSGWEVYISFRLCFVVVGTPGLCSYCCRRSFGSGRGQVSFIICSSSFLDRTTVDLFSSVALSVELGIALGRFRLPFLFTGCPASFPLQWPRAGCIWYSKNIRFGCLIRSYHHHERKLLTLLLATTFLGLLLWSQGRGKVFLRRHGLDTIRIQSCYGAPQNSGWAWGTPRRRSDMAGHP